MLRKNQLAQCLLTADLHGAVILVIQCKIGAFTGVSGVIICETTETFGIVMYDSNYQGILYKKVFISSHSTKVNGKLVINEVTRRRLCFLMGILRFFGLVNIEIIVFDFLSPFAGDSDSDANIEKNLRARTLPTPAYRLSVPSIETIVVPKSSSVFFIFKADSWKITLHGDKLASRNIGP
ncbi:uncharacterized protein LOC131327871 [Rhododendron vialii]|uniref:uncharacterized protein LOC131327871 n=1 Tax=Rhododendron vialii TaxID=182163 RepID=UPI00265D82DF|nr:uncharacterized protein LOC131327871 [Rhododendron vialii]